MSDNLVKRARKMAAHLPKGLFDDLADRIEALEATIAALRAENARLREALEIVAAPLDTFCIGREGDADVVVEGSSRFAHERDVLPRLLAARAALGDKP